MKRIANFIGFQGGWFACAWGGANERPWLGPVVVGAVLALQSTWIRSPGRQSALIFFVGASGTLIDAAHRGCGVIEFGAPSVWGTLCPLWMTALWMLFAGTVHESLGWLQGRPWLAAAFGLIGGPLSYQAGARMGAIQFGDKPLADYLVLGLTWAVAMPALCWLSRRGPFALRCPASRSQSGASLECGESSSGIVAQAV